MFPTSPPCPETTPWSDARHETGTPGRTRTFGRDTARSAELFWDFPAGFSGFHCENWLSEEFADGLLHKCSFKIQMVLMVHKVFLG